MASINSADALKPVAAQPKQFTLTTDYAKDGFCRILSLDGGGAKGFYTLGVLKEIEATTLTDRSKFVCANEQYYLLREDSPVTWQTAKCDEFLAAAVELWNQW